MTRTLHLLIHGRVQGIGYRAWFADEAVSRGLSGFVRNRREGTVEAVISGPSEAVAAMLEACRSGPAHAHVERIEEALAEAPPAGIGFRVAATV